jgi:hypothetical protein
MPLDGRTDIRTDMVKLTISFRNFANAPKDGLKRKMYELQTIVTLNLLVMHTTISVTLQRPWLRTSSKALGHLVYDAVNIPAESGKK